MFELFRELTKSLLLFWKPFWNRTDCSSFCRLASEAIKLLYSFSAIKRLSPHRLEWSEKDGSHSALFHSSLRSSLHSRFISSLPSSLHSPNLLQSGRLIALNPNKLTWRHQTSLTCLTRPFRSGRSHRFISSDKLSGKIFANPSTNSRSRGWFLFTWTVPLQLNAVRSPGNLQTAAFFFVL